MEAPRIDPKVKLGRWSSKLLAATAGGLLFLLLSGLIIYLAPLPSNFSESQGWVWMTTQYMILLHSLLGVLAAAVFAIYQWKHYFATRPESVDWGKLLGYFTFWVFVVSAVTGSVLIWQAWFETKITYWVDTVHTWDSFVLVPLLVWHLAGIWIRARRSAPPEALPALRRVQWGMAWRGAAVAVTLAAIGVLLGVFTQGADISAGVPPQTYSAKYGQDPFIPSNVRTSTNGAINAELLAGSENCGDCHVDIYKEWNVSAHRWSASDIFYTTVAGIMEGDTGIESTRYCGGCHNPIPTLSGNLTPATADKLKAEGKTTGQESLHFEEGISCLVCHGITSIHGTKGNANYEFTPPPRYLFEMEQGSGFLAHLSDYLIRSAPKAHTETLSRAHYKLPEFCGTCHKQYLDEFVNNFGWVRLQNQYDNWANSKWNQGEENIKETVVCMECHMPLLDNVKEVSSGVSDGDPFGPHPGQHRSHRWLAANQAIPWLEAITGQAELTEQEQAELREQAELTEQWLKGEYAIPEIEFKWEQGPAIDTTLLAPDAIQRGQPLEYQIVVSNNKAGHEFPTGPLDLIQTWIETKVMDATGKVVFHRGFLDDRNYVDPEAHYFRSFPIDEEGNVIERHNLWDMVGMTYVRVIFPGYAEQVAYEIEIPEDTPGPLTVSAVLRMRKFHQTIVDVATGTPEGEKGELTFPITDISSDTATVDLTPGVARK